MAQRINNARASSLSYPYEAYYVVEVPSNLRIYGGGWRMDTVLQPPGMMLIRESSFPTERFENVIARERRYGRNSESEQDQRVFQALLDYFGNDGQGGSPFAGFARNFGIASNLGNPARCYRVAVLTRSIVEPTYHTNRKLFNHTSTEFGNYIPYLGDSRTPDNYRSNAATQARLRIATLPWTWEVMDRIGLLDLDFDTNPIPSSRVLLAKGYP